MAGRVAAGSGIVAGIVRGSLVPPSGSVGAAAGTVWAAGPTVGQASAGTVAEASAAGAVRAVSAGIAAAEVVASSFAALAAWLCFFQPQLVY